MKLAAVALALAAVACKSPAPAGPPRPVTARTGETTGPALSCRKPELWLALYPRDEIPAHYCEACDDRCTPAMQWSFLSGDVLRFGCDDLAYARSTILAYHDVAIGDEPWRSYFAAQPWYRPIRTPDELPPAARANADWLGTVIDVCEGRVEAGYVRAYKPAIVQWFQRKKAGDVRLPDTLFVDSQPATPAQFREFLDHGAPGTYFNYDLRTPIRDTSQSWWDRFPDRTIVAFSVGTSAPTLSCVDTSGVDCEGYEHIELVFDASTRELVALAVSAAG
jgi:hypothetical protein